MWSAAYAKLWVPNFICIKQVSFGRMKEDKESFCKSSALAPFSIGCWAQKLWLKDDEHWMFSYLHFDRQGMSGMEEADQPWAALWNLRCYPQQPKSRCVSCWWHHWNGLGCPSGPLVSPSQTLLYPSSTGHQHCHSMHALHLLRWEGGKEWNFKL